MTAGSSTACVWRAKTRSGNSSSPGRWFGLAWADGLIGSFGGYTGFSFRLVLPMAVLVGGLLAINGWQQNQRVAEVEEIDALLLTDDLPLDAYLDKGFEAWLKKRSPL